MRGSKPQPAALRELLGARTRPHHHDEMPVDPQDAKPGQLTTVPANVPAPKSLTKVERAYWNKFAPLLAGARILTPADEQTLAHYCRACAWVDASSARLRTAWKKRKIDMRRIRMLDAQARGWMERSLKLASELGLTAISRSRVGWSGHTPSTSKPKSKAPITKLQQLQEQAREMRRPVNVEKEMKS